MRIGTKTGTKCWERMRGTGNKTSRKFNGCLETSYYHYSVAHPGDSLTSAEADFASAEGAGEVSSSHITAVKYTDTCRKHKRNLVEICNYLFLDALNVDLTYQCRF